MSPVYQRLNQIVSRYLSGVNAQSVLGRALRESGLDQERLRTSDLSILLPKLDRGIRLFLVPSQQLELWTELTELAEAPPPSSRHRVPIRSEQDVSHARVLARSVCEENGSRTLTRQTVATIVSELARNIVSYTSGGAIELDVVAGKAPKVVIRATDEGRGIPNLDEIFSGRYRSTTGLGKGLLGVKRLSNRFEIETGAYGTSIAVEVNL